MTYLRGLHRGNNKKISTSFAILGFSCWKYQNEILYKVATYGQNVPTQFIIFPNY